MNIPEALRRLNQVSSIVNQSYAQLYSAYGQKTLENNTGFQGMPPQLIQGCLVNAMVANRNIRSAMDLGCGNGGFALMAAALGWDSYGIDASAALVQRACQLRDVLRAKGLIDPGVVCEFTVGSIYPQSWQARYERFVARTAKNAFTMPVGAATDAYERFGIELADVDMIYAFTWSDQMPILCSYLNEAAAANATFLLPHYRGVEGRFDEDLKLKPLQSHVPSALFLGVRERSVSFA